MASVTYIYSARQACFFLLLNTSIWRTIYYSAAWKHNKSWQRKFGHVQYSSEVFGIETCNSCARGDLHRPTATAGESAQLVIIINCRRFAILIGFRVFCLIIIRTIMLSVRGTGDEIRGRSSAPVNSHYFHHWHALIVVRLIVTLICNRIRYVSGSISITAISHHIASTL